MALKMLFNGGLMLFFIYSYAYTFINPPPPTVLPHDMDGAQWARGILVLLIFFLALNIISIYRKAKPEERNLSSITSLNFGGIFTSKLFHGMAIMFGYAYFLPRVGFLVSSFVMVMLYMVLLGERRWVRVPVYGAIIVSVFYVFFLGGMDVWLPRGTGVFWNFSMTVEQFFR
ncbi:MAG: tripartite tricarboxylate transporter TctB family protein [Defluviitaleaceae bacterium]|nr:tripartite tricarboxylate transporter TctB family protein [Defluviitaleaceae bacterium]